MAVKRDMLLLLLLLSTVLCLQLNVCDASSDDYGTLSVIRGQQEHANDWNRFSNRDTGEGTWRPPLYMSERANFTLPYN